MSTQADPFITVEEYLRREAVADVRHEYFNGEVFAMAGGTPAHAGLQSNLLRHIGNAIAGRGCRAFGSDLGVKLPSGVWTYPDISIGCAPRYDRNFLLNPSILFEILSESTEAYDRGEKFRLFRALPSLEQYVLVSQTEMYVESFTRGSGNRWTLEALSEPGVVGEFQQVLRILLPAGQSAEVPLAAIYEEVVFTDNAPATSAE